MDDMSRYDYGKVARQVYTAEIHTYTKPCLGGTCDEDVMCKRHDKTLELAARLERLRSRKRART